MWPLRPRGAVGQGAMGALRVPWECEAEGGGAVLLPEAPWLLCRDRDGGRQRLLRLSSRAAGGLDVGSSGCGERWSGSGCIL